MTEYGHGAGTVASRTVLLEDLTPEDISRWSRLSNDPLEPSPFVTPEFLMSAHRLFGGTDDVRMVVVEQDDRWIAALPLSPMGRLRSTPVRYASTAGPLLGRRASLCAPLVDRERANDAVGGLLEHLAARRARLPGLIELTLLPADGALARLITDQCRARSIPVQERSRFSRAYALAAPEPTAPDHMSSSRRKQLRRRERGLERVVGAPLEFIDHGNSLAAFDRLLDLEVSGWKGERGSAVRKKPREEAWCTDVFRGFSELDRARVFELRAGEVTLYMSQVLVSGRTAFGLIDAYDEQYSTFSPGSIGRVLEQQRLLALDAIDAFDPCMHPDRYPEATTLYPSRRDIISLLLAPRWPDRLLLHIRPALRRLRQTRGTRPAASDA